MARISELLAAGPTLSFEFGPPRDDEGARRLEKVLHELRPLAPAFVSVTYGAGGSTKDKTVELVRRIRDEYGIEAMAHFTCVGASVPELRETLADIREAGIDNVLALRGDPPRGQTEWVASEDGFEYSHQLVALLKRAVCRGHGEVHLTRGNGAQRKFISARNHAKAKSAIRQTARVIENPVVARGKVGQLGSRFGAGLLLKLHQTYQGLANRPGRKKSHVEFHVDGLISRAF